MTGNDQPFIDAWPSWDEPLSKIAAPLDIEAARWKLAQRFNSRPPKIPPAIRAQQIDAAWRRHSNRYVSVAARGGRRSSTNLLDRGDQPSQTEEFPNG